MALEVQSYEAFNVEHQFNTKRVRVLCGRKSEFYVALLIEDKWYQAAHQIKGESLAINQKFRFNGCCQVPGMQGYHMGGQN